MADPIALSLAACQALDARPDVLAPLAARFAQGEPGTIYLDANSIGPMPADVPQRLARLLDEGWRVARRRSWNTSDWLEQPQKLGAAIAAVIGAGPADVIVCDSTSVNQYKLLRFALDVAAASPTTPHSRNGAQAIPIAPPADGPTARHVIVLERPVFPTNRYVGEAIARAGLATIRDIEGYEDLEAALAPGDVAVVALSHVDYRSSRRLPMSIINRLARRYGALTLWDLSHSAGAVAVNLREAMAEADLAIGCGYKYLCGGPGAPSFLYVHPRLQTLAWPAIAGWMGHADLFAFAPDYRPAPDIRRQLAGTPAVIANAVFAAAAELWRLVDPQALDARHRSLTDTLIALLDAHGSALGIEVTSPREHAHRGGHVSVRLALADANIDALGQALVAAGVVVSTRKPDALRFGVHPLTTRHADLWHAVERLTDILRTGRWRDPRFAGASK